MNQWGIPELLEKKVRARDRQCIYCGGEFTARSAGRVSKRISTWEHIDNDRWDDSSIMFLNVGLCCNRCNSSKGAKPLREWLSSTAARPQLNRDVQVVVGFPPSPLTR